MRSTTNEGTVTNLRCSRRFNVIHPVRIQFVGDAAEVLNLSAEGIQIRHAAFVKLGMRATIRIDYPVTRETVSLQARILWSRLSTIADATGKYLYVSGLLIEDAATVGGALGRLIRTCAAPDSDSMEKKRKSIEERAQRRTVVMTPVAHEMRVSSDQLLLIQEAREKLEANPEQMTEWCGRAKRLAAKDADAPHSLPYRQEILAIWGYLGGHVELEQVALVCEMAGPRARN